MQISPVSFKVHYRPQRSCEGYVFTRVCDSVHKGGGCYPSMHCRWYPSMPCSRSPGGGMSASGGVPALGRCLFWGGACSGAGCLLQGCACFGGAMKTPHKSRWLLLRTVRILLECILVIIKVYYKTHISENILGITGFAQFAILWRLKYILVCIRN